MDTGFGFGADGSYGTETDEGHWRLRGNMVVATITARNPDGDIGPPMVKLAKPEAIRTQLIGYTASVMTVMTEGKKEYWYRCPKGTDAGS